MSEDSPKPVPPPPPPVPAPPVAYTPPPAPVPYNPPPAPVPSPAANPVAQPAAMPPPAPAPFATTPMGMAPAPAVRGMYTAAAIINWVTLALIVVLTFGIGIIAAAWFVPITIMIHKGAKGPYKHTGLAVCTLLFCNIISGILMLVDDGDKPAAPVA